MLPQKIDKNIILAGVSLIAILIVGGLILIQSGKIILPSFLNLSFLEKSDQLIAKEAIEFINKNLLSSSTASLIEAKRESGVIKIKIKINNQEYDSYVTKDGKFLFPSGIDMKNYKDEFSENSVTQPSEEEKQAAIEKIKKTENPLLEVYVVSMCPFGVQMQRAMAKAIEELPLLEKYVKVRYMGDVSSDGKTIHAMHGEKEAEENLRQICIREEQPSKYWKYISCYIKKGDASGCQTSVGLDVVKLNACMSNPARGIAYAKKDFELNDKYNITGSPTSILNEQEISEFYFGGRSANAVKEMVCAAFVTKPEFCSQQLTQGSAATSFSENYSNSSSSANSSASCE